MAERKVLDENEITARAKVRRLERHLNDLGAFGYPQEEWPQVRHILSNLHTWYTDKDTMLRADRMVEEWKSRLERDYAAGGTDPRTYRFFHAIGGSTPPKNVVYQPTPDLPGDDAVFVLMERINQALAASGPAR